MPPLDEGGVLARIWLVGCGAMGGALAARWLQSGLPDSALTIIDPVAELPERLDALRVRDVAAAVARMPQPSLVVLAVKPQQLLEVAPDLLPELKADPVLVSILAGVRVTTLTDIFTGCPVARIVPNTPARIGAGVTALFAPQLDAAQADAVDRLLKTNGITVWLDDEARFDAVTALSGSGPAFLYRFVEAMAGAGEAAGLDPETARLLATETVAGAARLMHESGESPAVLRAQVTSPNGTTQAGLDVLDGSDGALSILMRQTLRSATERGRALAAQADAALHDDVRREVQRV